MTNADELKRIFHEGWTNPSVVAHRVERFIDGEFGFAPSRRAWRESLKQAASRSVGRRALDMGTGPGTIAQMWAELGYETTGVDFSATMLTAGRDAAERRELAIDFVEADVEEPPFPEASFDVVSSRAVLFTLPHPGYAVARWVRLLLLSYACHPQTWQSSVSAKSPLARNQIIASDAGRRYDRRNPLVAPRRFQ